jgi:6-phosphogluconolactonase
MKSFSPGVRFVLCVLSLVSAVLPVQADSKRHRAELAFVANQSGNNVSAYQITTSGALVPVTGSPFPGGGSPNSVTVVPSGLFAYVADVIPGSVSGFTVAQNGALTPIPGSPFAAPTGTAFVINDPSGRFVYALNCGAICSGSGSGNIAGYTVDQHTGALTPMAGSPFAAGQFPYSLAVDPTGHFAYVANMGSGDVYSFAIDSVSGALTQVGLPATAGIFPISVVVDPWSQYVYVANTGSGTVSAFSINFDGSLSTVAGSPFAVGEFTAGIAASSNGKFLIAAAGAGAYVYTITSTGALQPVGSPYRAGTGPNGISIDPTDCFVYLVNAGSGNVSAYVLDEENGKLTPVKGSPFPAGAFAAGLATSPVPLHD